MPATRAQRLAIKRVYDRCPVYKDGVDPRQKIINAGWTFIDGERTGLWVHPNLMRGPMFKDHHDVVKRFFPEIKPLTYRQFRKTIQQGWDCLMVQWCGMWLGIEKDGYTHS